MISKSNWFIRLVSTVHPCVDRIEFIDWICKKKIQFWFFRVLRFGFSPALLYSLSQQENLSLEERSRLHTLCTSHLRAGNTVKTTGEARTKHADDCVLEEIGRTSKPRFLEVGVSDGSSTLELLYKRELFSEIKLSDRYPFFLLKPHFGGYQFYDADGRSYGRKVFGVLFNTKKSTVIDPAECIKVESINPLVKEISGLGTIHLFDVFCSVEEEKFDIIKCANLLNLIYFSENRVYDAISNLAKSLKVGGILIISQNNEKYKDGEAVICARHVEYGKLQIYKQINEHELLNVLETSESVVFHNS